MAKKKDIFDDLDDINLDDFDMGGDLGLDDISFGGSGRTPVQKIKYSFKNAAKEKAGSLDFHLKSLKRILPKEYRGALDAIGAGKSSIDSVYGKTLDKLRPLSNDLKEFSRGILPSANKVLPRNLRDKLNAWANSTDSASDYEDVNGAREAIIGQNLQDIFVTNLRETAINAAHQRKYQGFKDKVSYLRHAENRDIFRGIFKGISRIAGYNDNITFKWQRKTLELQYRHYYQNEDLINRVTKGNEIIVKALSAITRNTSLPDALKIEMKEMLGYETKQAIVRKLQTRTFGSINSLVDRMATNLGRKIDDALDTAGMLTGSLAMGGGMASSGMVNGYDIGAGTLLDQLAAMGGDRLNGIIGRNSRVRGLGARLQANIAAGKAYAQNKSQTSSMWRFITDLMSEQDDLKIKASGSSLTAPATIDNQVKKTWITVIPGLLSRIHREIAILRTGDTSIGLTKYNFDKDRFMDGVKGKNQITRSLMSKGGGRYTSDSIKRVLEQIDPDNKLSASQKSIIRRRVMDDAMVGKAFYAENYLDSTKYEATDDRKDIASIIRFLRNDYKAGKKVKIGQNYDIDIKRAKAAELTKDLGLYVNDLILELDRQLMMGYDEELEELGFIKDGDYGSEWDKVRIRQFLLEDIGPDTIVAPNEERARQERLQANAQAIRTRARGILDRMIRRSRVGINRAGRRFRRFSRSESTRSMTDAIRRSRERATDNLNSAMNSPTGRSFSNRFSNIGRRVSSTTSSARSRFNNLNVVRSGVNRESLTADLRNIQFEITNTSDYQSLIERIEVIENAISSSPISVSSDAIISETRDALRAVRENIRQTIPTRGDSPQIIESKLARTREYVRENKRLLGNYITQLSARARDSAANVNRFTRNRINDLQSTTSNQINGINNYLRGAGFSTTSQSDSPHDTQLKMLEIQTKILEANIVQTRLLEGGLSVNGIVIERGGLYKGLRAGAGKLLSGMGGLLGGTAKLYGSLLGGIAGGVKGAFGLAGSVLGRVFQGVRYSDIYVRGNPRHPILLARDLRAGLYRDKTTGKVIRRIKDILGPVVDAEGNEVITVEDINKGLYDIQGKPLLKGLANKVIGFYGAMLSPFVTVAKIANWTIKKTFSLATRDKDVYVLGETSPRLLARVLQAGGYRSSVTGKPIYSVRDIDGDVMDTTGEHVILSVSEMTKLVDRRGNPYRTAGEKFRDLVRGAFKYTIGMPFKMAWKLTKGTYKLGAGIIKGGVKLIGNVIKGFGLGSIRSLATSAAYGDLVSRNPELLINVHQNEILLSMLELLNARLPGGRRKRGDEDGDGYRDGSWQERLQALRNTHSGNAEKAKRGNPERAPRNEESGGGFLSKLMLGGLGGNILKLLGGKGGKGGMLARILGGGLLGTVASSLFGGSGEGGEEGGLSTSSLALGAAGAGLMTMPGTLFKAARGLGSLGVRAATSGGGLLLRGAMMAAPILGGLASAIGGIISAPVVLGVLGVSALGAGAYYLYKKYKGDRAGFLMLRMAQYGVLPDEKDRVEKILELEEELKDSVRINGEEVNITITQKKLTAIAGIFGITQANKEALNNWAVWVQNRFKPVFMKHSVMAFKYFGKTDLSLLDDKLEPDQKVDVLKSLAIPDNGSNYLRNYSPFGSELKTDYELTDMILNQVVVKAKEDQGGNFVTRWWKNTFGGTPESPKKTEENTIPETIRAPGYKPVDPKTAYSQMAREAKGVNDTATRGYRRLGEQTNTVVRKPFNDTQSVTPVPATTANVTRAFPRNTPIVPDIPATNGKYFLPVRGSVTSAFGQRRAPVAGASTNHKGIDLKASIGTPVVAMANGVIIKREVQRGYGNIVYLQHAGGIVSKYAHLSRFQEGQMVGSRVSGGQIIGYAGATGRVSGPHLHFEIVDSSGKQIDPEQFLKGTNGGGGAVSASQEMIANQARRFANDDIDTDDTPESISQAPSAPKSAPVSKPIPYSGGKAFNPNAGPKPSKPKEPVRANVPAPEPAQPIVKDTATRRQLQESTHREQVRTQASIESSRILSDLLEVNRSMLSHLASIDRKVGGSVAPPPKQQDVENPISMKANRNIGN